MNQDINKRVPYGPVVLLLAAMLLILAVGRRETAPAPPVLPTPPAPPAPRRFQVSAWVPYWDRARVRASFAAHVADLDEVNFFWYEVQPDGALSAFPGAEDAALLARARAHDLRVLPTIMNDFDGPRVAALLADEKTLATHVQAIVTLVEEMDYDGVDVDYEALPAGSRDDFTAFVEALAVALDERDKLLSLAIHPKIDDRGTWDGPRAQDWPRLGAAADAFKVMIYDNHWGSSVPGAVAPLAWIDDVLAYAEQTVPSEKIWMGLPFYGYDWVEQKGKGLFWDAAGELIQQYEPVTRRDASSGELYFSYTAGDVEHTVYIPDAQAIALKVRLARARHPDIAGVAIWRLGGGSPEYWTAILQER